MKIALITGASEGVGKKICEALSSEGFRIVAIDSVKTEDLKKSLKNIQNHLELVVGGADFSNPQSIIDSLASFLPNQNWTVLVNSMGENIGGNLLESTLDQWKQMIDTNLTVPFVLSQAFAKNSQKNNIKGSIINISSMAGITGAKKPGYAASRAGIFGLTKSIAMQLGPNVRCNTIYTGAVNDKMHADWDNEKRKKVIEATPIGRIAEPEEIANIVSFLADDKRSGFMTGAIINATGGQYLGQ